MRLTALPLLACLAGSALLLAGCTTEAPAAVRATVSASATPSPMPTFPALPAGSLGRERAAALQRALDASRRIGYPDALATVITPDGVWSGASGEDGPRGRPARPDDVFSIASVTKTFTAALVLKLAEQRKLDLDAPLSKYLDPAAAARSNGATVRQALAMRAGIPDTPDAVRTAALADPRAISSIDDIVRSMPAATAPPGGAASSSNPTYKLLALAAERAAGGKWADLVRSMLVAPAAVPGTLVVQSAGTRTPGRWALPSSDGPWGVGGTLPFVADTSFSYGATDMAADTRSLATWGWALFAGRIVSPASLAAMAVSDGEIGSGLDPYPAGLGHQGGKPGYATILLADPAKRTVVAVAVNDEEAALDVIAANLIDALR